MAEAWRAAHRRAAIGWRFSSWPRPSLRENENGGDSAKAKGIKIRYWRMKRGHAQKYCRETERLVLIPEKPASRCSIGLTMFALASWRARATREIYRGDALTCSPAAPARINRRGISTRGRRVVAREKWHDVYARGNYGYRGAAARPSWRGDRSASRHEMAISNAVICRRRGLRRKRNNRRRRRARIEDVLVMTDETSTRRNREAEIIPWRGRCQIIEWPAMTCRKYALGRRSWRHASRDAAASLRAEGLRVMPVSHAEARRALSTRIVCPGGLSNGRPIEIASRSA